MNIITHVPNRETVKRPVQLKTGFLLSTFLFGLLLQAQVRPAHIFDNNMVLQRDKPVPITDLSPGEQAMIKHVFHELITGKQELKYQGINKSVVKCI